MLEKPFNPFQKQSIKNVKKIIAVGSGKGGVGKSTVSVNLALALKKEGFQVGLLDADIHGPSIPRLMGVSNQRPQIDEKTKKIYPIKKFGIQMISMGFLVEEDLPVIWRGPMLFKAIQQFFFDIFWDHLDYLIVDLPPGTGDIALTMAQKISVNGAIVVCTPQNLALIDAKKAVALFEKVKISVLGLVENMSGFFFQHENNKTETQVSLFPKGDLDLFLKIKKIEKLACIPFHPNIGISSEAGFPIVESHVESRETLSFRKMAKNLVTHFKNKTPKSVKNTQT